jgi:hypothetical protein
MYFILNTKYTLSLKFVPAQVPGNNYIGVPVRNDWKSSIIPVNFLKGMDER